MANIQYFIYCMDLLIFLTSTAFPYFRLVVGKRNQKAQSDTLSPVNQYMYHVICDLSSCLWRLSLGPESEKGRE